MKKAWNIALKDLRITFRDPVALVLMLVSPLALTLVIVAAFGGGDGSSMLQDIPVALVNHDLADGYGEFSEYLTGAFESEDLADLVEPQMMDDEQAARALVDDDKLAAVVIIPADFSEAILPPDMRSGDPTGVLGREPSVVIVYANPGRSISAGIVRSIVDTVLADYTNGSVSGWVTMLNLVMSERVDGTNMEALNAMGETVGRKAIERTVGAQLISVQTRATEGGNSFSYLAYMAPSMAILYLMFTTSQSGRSILVERDNGTLPRMLVSPTRRWEVLGGKMLSTFLTGLGQMLILIITGHYFFHLNWGPANAVILVTVALVAAAVGWGLVVAAFARTPGQAGAIGTAINLTFAALAGNFVPRMAYPKWLQSLGAITPNAWGLDSYYDLINGATLTDMVPALIALTTMAVVMFAVAILGFRRQYR